MKSRSLLLAVFVVLTILFAAVSTIEYTEVSQLSAQVSAMSAGTGSSGRFLVQASRPLGATGEIVIGVVGTYDFEAANYTVPNTFVFENVTFSSMPHITTGAICAQFNATLSSGQTFPLAACAFDVFLGGEQAGSVSMQSVITFSNQTRPAVGVMLLSDQSAYVLVWTGH